MTTATLDCEMCGGQFGFGKWHQLKPVDRWLCNLCAERDQRDTHPTNWHGEYLPPIELGS